MTVCSFFGHQDSTGIDEIIIYRVVKALMLQGVDTFYVGNQGRFDREVYKSLKRLKKIFPQIHYSVVLAYPPGKRRRYELYDEGCTMYPEEVADGPARFAIDRRNRWPISKSDYCVCYINHTWGNAYKYAMMARRCAVTVINLGRAELRVPDNPTIGFV